MEPLLSSLKKMLRLTTLLVEQGRHSGEISPKMKCPSYYKCVQATVQIKHYQKCWGGPFFPNSRSMVGNYSNFYIE